MRLDRRRSFAVLLIGLWAATTAHAQTFVITGRAGSASGGFIDLPAIGSSPCHSITQAFRIGFVAPQTITLGGTGSTPFNTSMAVAFPGGCIADNPAPQWVTTTGMGGSGAGFTVPPGLVSQPFPGSVQTVPVPLIPNLQQLATSLQLTMPPAVPFEALNQTMATGSNTAPWRQLRSNNFAAHTGRAGGSFTWCLGTLVGTPGMLPNPACTNIAQGQPLSPAIIKNTAGANQFGGTMGLVITTGANTSTLAVLGLPFAPTGVGLQIVAGMGSRAAGRGYAAYDTDPLLSGPVFSMYTLTMTGAFGLIGMVSGPLPTPLPAGTNRNFGFPFTTGQVIVRNTGTAQGMANVITHTVAGFDTVTPMGTRNIQLVAGHLAKSTVEGNSATPNFGVLRLAEPRGEVGLIAAAMVLLAIAAWRASR